MAPMPKVPTLGGVIDQKYCLERLIGEGGMGQVWQARHLVTEKALALKFLKGPPSTRAVQHFAREARLASAVRHAHVVAVHDVIVVADTPVMVMDLLEGESLRNRLEREGRGT